MSTPTSHITSVYNYVSAQEDVTIAGAAADGAKHGAARWDVVGYAGDDWAGAGLAIKF